MRCRDLRFNRLPLDLQQNVLLIRVADDPETMRHDTANLLEAAQGQGSLQLVRNCHRYYELTWAAIQEVGGSGAQAVSAVGDAIATTVPGARFMPAGSRIHVYSDSRAHMAAHRDKDGMHPFVSSSMSVPKPACAVKFASGLQQTSPSPLALG